LMCTVYCCSFINREMGRATHSRWNTRGCFLLLLMISFQRLGKIKLVNNIKITKMSRVLIVVIFFQQHTIDRKSSK